jgi:hypothetical protein
MDMMLKRVSKRGRLGDDDDLLRQMHAGQTVVVQTSNYNRSSSILSTKRATIARDLVWPNKQQNITSQPQIAQGIYLGLPDDHTETTQPSIVVKTLIYTAVNIETNLILMKCWF